MLTDDEYGSEWYEAEVKRWRANLPDLHVKTLAYDYMKGRIDPVTTDAYLEYKHRWPWRNPGRKTVPKIAMPQAPENSPLDDYALDHASNGDEAITEPQEVILDNL